MTKCSIQLTNMNTPLLYLSDDTTLNATALITTFVEFQIHISIKNCYISLYMHVMQFLCLRSTMTHYPIYIGSIPESIQTFDASIISFIGSWHDIRQSNWHVSRRPRLGQHVRCRCRNTKRCSVIHWHKGDWNVGHVCFGPHFAGNHSVLLYFDDRTVSLKMDDAIDLM